MAMVGAISSERATSGLEAASNNLLGIAIALPSGDASNRK